MKSLYVTDRAAIGDERFLRILQTLRGRDRSVRVQIREKRSSDREILDWSTRTRETVGSDLPIYVNRRFDLALASGAHGVHLPADGLPLDRVRANTPRGFRIGVSTHEAEEAAEAIANGADLVVLGPIFRTPSKLGGEPLGPDSLAALPPAASHGAEIFAIGGVNEKNLAQILPWRDRISGVAGIRLFQDAADAGAVAERIASLG